MTSSDQPFVLIAAPSGRALAAVARQAGYRPLVVDCFDDLDTRQLAAANVSVAAAFGFEAAPLLEALGVLAEGRDPVGLVYGGGFEDRPQIIAELARHFTLYGNAAATVARVKDPCHLAELCRMLAIPHPDICFDAPADSDRWLIKHTGGGGGRHITPAAGRALGPGDYYQRQVAGRPVSALLLGDGRAAFVLGLSAQWVAPSAETPFRFGGAVRPARVPERLAESIAEAAARIAAASALVGLNSIDFVVSDEAFHLIEINPRPGATLDIFADSAGTLFAAHLAACAGRLPQTPPRLAAAAAAAIVYAPRDVAAMPHLEWPDWCHDRQKPQTGLRKDDPICTVTAEAETPEAARALLDERSVAFLRFLTDSASKEAAA